MPIDAKDFTGVASFIIELDFDPAVLTFVELLNENAGLDNGTFSVSVVNNTLQIRYSAISGSVTLPNGEQLFSLHFNGLAAGLSNLDWNLLQCNIYSSSGDTIPSIFTPGLVDVLPSPTIYADGNGVYCEGDNLTLHAGSLDGQILSYEWTSPSGFRFNQPEWQLGQLGINDDGDFVLVATNPELCDASQTVSVKVNPKPVISIASADTLCFGQQIMLDAGSGYVSYLWQDGTNVESQLVYEEGVYWVQVVDSNSCRAVDTVRVLPCNLELLIPNAFTPNGDGLNDIFKPLFSGFETTLYNLSIYSKWGQLLFTSNEESIGWDGRIDGELAPPGVYVYVVSYEAPAYVTRALPSPVTGDVTLVR
jgi:gliding motility-associated-like protein